MRNIVVLGSTGSIGRLVLDVVRRYPQDFRVIGLMARRNISLLNAQIREFKPHYVGIYEERLLKDICFPRRRLFAGLEALEILASSDNYEKLVFAIPGFVGYPGLLSGIRKGRIISLANKEILVSLGPALIKEIEKYKAKILPLDSEHFAIWQCLFNRDSNQVKNLYLTCSGGPFWKRKSLERVRKSEVLRHPRWHMGKKISVDSATLINKGLEVIEAHFLFNIPYDNIKILIHQEVLLHGLVEFIDSSFLGYIFPPDMRIPILYSLSFPQRRPVEFVRFDFKKIRRLTFELPDMKRFPGLKMALDAGRYGGSMPCVFSAANEVAVENFLKGKIGFKDIIGVIRKAIKNHKYVKSPSLEELIEIHYSSRRKTEEIVNSKSWSRE